MLIDLRENEMKREKKILADLLVLLQLEVSHHKRTNLNEYITYGAFDDVMKQYNYIQDLKKRWGTQ